MASEVFNVREGKVKPTNAVRIDGKTFRFVNGVAEISVFDKQSRLTKLEAYAKKNGLAYKLREGDKIYRP